MEPNSPLMEHNSNRLLLSLKMIRQRFGKNWRMYVLVPIIVLLVLLIFVGFNLLKKITNSDSEISGMDTEGKDRIKSHSNCTAKFAQTQLPRLDNNYTAATTEIIEYFIHSSRSEIVVVGLLPSTTNKLRNIEAERIFKALIKKAEENVSILIILDTYETANINLNRLLKKIQNTKNTVAMVEKGLQQTLFIFDETHMYHSIAPIGQITTSRKESCILFSNCSYIVNEVKKILHELFPNIQLCKILRTQEPLNVCFNDEDVTNFSWTTSLRVSVNRVISAEDAYISTVSQAKEFIYIAINEYDPNISTNSSKKVYWPLIEQALRSAASNNVKIRILTSMARNKNPYLESLNEIPGIEVKRFIIPSKSNDDDLNQDRFMVTERGLYYGMPKLSGDDFINLLAIGLVLEESSNQSNISLRQTIVHSFEQHWDSKLAKPL